MTRFPLTAEQVQQYNIEGYVVVDAVFGRDDLAKIDAAIRELTQRALKGEDSGKIMELEPDALDGQRVPRRIFSPYDQHPAFRDLAHDPRLLDRIESLIGADFNLQHGKLNMKPAKNVGEYASLYELQARTKSKHSSKG